MYLALNSRCGTNPALGRAVEMYNTVMAPRGWILQPVEQRAAVFAEDSYKDATDSCSRWRAALLGGIDHERHLRASACY